MELLTAALAFLGAVAGAWVGRALDRQNLREAERRRRLEDAYRAVAATIARQHWSPRADLTTMGRTQNAATVMKSLNQDAIKRFFSSLREARERVALVTLDGVDTHDWWRSDEAMQAHLDETLRVLTEALRVRGDGGKRRRRSGARRRGRRGGL